MIKFKELMKNQEWKDTLAIIDENIEQLKKNERKVNKLEVAKRKYGSNTSLKRKMTLTNFDEFTEYDTSEGGSPNRRISSLEVI